MPLKITIRKPHKCSENHHAVHSQVWFVCCALFCRLVGLGVVSFVTLFWPSAFCRNFSSPGPSLLRGPGILKSHGNGQFGGSFRRCVRCDFVVSVVLHEFRYSPSPLKTDATYKKTEKTEKT